MKSSKNTCLFWLFLSRLLLQGFLLILFGTLLLPQPALAFAPKPIHIEEDMGFDSIFRLAAADYCSSGRDQLVVLGRNYIENTALCRAYSWSGGAWERIWESGNLIEEKSPIFLEAGRPFASGEETVIIMTNHRMDILTYSTEGFTLTSQLYHTLLPQEINVADVDGDGIDEILVARVGEVGEAYLDMAVEVYALTESAEGAVSLHNSALVGAALGDFDGDGVSDLAVAGYPAKLFLLTGDQGFTVVVREEEEVE